MPRRLHHIFLITILLVAALFIRFWRYEYIPFQSDGDEMAYVFAGQSWLETGIPHSWSVFTLPGRQEWQTLRLGDEAKNAADTFTFVYPWFDHPPLMPLLQGLWTKAWGYSFPSMVPSAIIRMPMLVFSLMTLILTYLVSRHFFGIKAGIITLTLMAFSPSLVIGQRMVTGENISIPLLLMSLYLLIRKKPVVLAIGLNALAGLAKITGLLAIPVTVLYLVVYKRYREAVIVGVGSMILFVGLYGWYGFSINGEQFLLALQAQSYRFMGWSNPVFLLSHPGFRYTTMLDMSYYLILFLGLAPFLTIPLTLKKEVFWGLAIIGALVLIWLSSAEQDMLGWYKLPLFTFLSITSGYSFYLNQGNLVFLLLLLITILANVGLVRYPEHPLPHPLLMRSVISLGLMMITGSYLAWLWLKRDQIKHFLIVALLGLYMMGGFYAIHQHYQVLCKDTTCPIPLLSFRELISVKQQ
jgi:hypothetical protein